MGAHLDIVTNGEIRLRSAGLRSGVPGSSSCKGAVPEAGAPVNVRFTTACAAASSACLDSVIWAIFPKATNVGMAQPRRLEHCAFDCTSGDQTLATEGFLVAQPGRAKEKSPAFQRWDLMPPPSSPARDDGST